MKTHAGHWADNSTRFADLGAGVSHRQAEGPYVCSPDGCEEPHDRSQGNLPMLIAAVVVFLPILIAAVVLLARFFLKAPA